VHWAPGIPHALSLSGRFFQQLGRIAPREGEGVSGRHCEQKEAIHTFSLRHHALRSGACHPARVRARNDDFKDIAWLFEN
jgi:hypothetical protein